jgi:hypothetical protein
MSVLRLSFILFACGLAALFARKRAEPDETERPA